jgi:hypothetical protein
MLIGRRFEDVAPLRQMDGYPSVLFCESSDEFREHDDLNAMRRE